MQLQYRRPLEANATNRVGKNKSGTAKKEKGEKEQRRAQKQTRLLVGRMSPSSGDCEPMGWTLRGRGEGKRIGGKKARAELKADSVHLQRGVGRRPRQTGRKGRTHELK